MKATLLGRKIGMTRVYDEKGTIVPVSVVQAGPCPVTQIKTVETDGYNAVQIGYEPVKAQRTTKPLIGHAGAAGVKPVRTYREIRLDAPAEDIQPGQELKVSIFEGIGWVDIIGVSKGKGFAGGMKRHNFRGLGASHGVERKHRSPGAISSHGNHRGGTGGPKKGKRMAGHLGAERCTSRNHVLISVDAESNLLLIKGPIPGPVGGLVMVRTSNKHLNKSK